MIVPYDATRVLIGGNDGGLYLYDGQRATKLSADSEKFLKENLTSGGIRLKSGLYAITTLRGGMAVIDGRGVLRDKVDINAGGLDNDMKCVYEDVRGNLWIGLSSGISRVEYSSPFQMYDQRMALPGMALSICRVGNTLFAGVDKGLFRIREADRFFSPIPGVTSECWSLVTVDDSVLAATSEGVFLIKNDHIAKILPDFSQVLAKSRRYPPRIWCGARGGVYGLMPSAQGCAVDCRIPVEMFDVRSVAEDDHGDIWLGSDARGVRKVMASRSGKPYQILRFNEEAGAPEGSVSVCEAAGRVLFASEKGVFTFSETEHVFSPFMAFKTTLTDPSRPVFRIMESPKRHVWLHSKSQSHALIMNEKGAYEMGSTDLLRLPLIQVNSFYADPLEPNYIWLASFDGLIRYNSAHRNNGGKKFPALIRKVFVNDKLIYDGGEAKETPFRSPKAPEFDYKSRNIRFEFAAPFFEAEERVVYQCFLQGYDGNWSSWEKHPRRNYTNLGSGAYTFWVQAQNVYLDKSMKGKFSFIILPPWYWTWWSIAGYFLLLLVFIYSLFKWRLFYLERKNTELSTRVEERTQELTERTKEVETRKTEVEEKNRQLESQTRILIEQSKKLVELDSVKSRFFTNISHEFRTPLTIILNPLQQMLNNENNAAQKKRFRIMKRSANRLLLLINQLLELSAIDSGEMALTLSRRDFISFVRGVLESFQMLILQNELSLVFEAGEKEIPACFDIQKMEEVLCNLIFNAVKYTPARGRIVVSVSLSAENGGDEPGGMNGDAGRPWLRISVTDTGQGIAKDDLEHLFERFYPGKSGLAGPEYKSTGIGLALAREIILLHKGRIDVHSREGLGSEFVVWLPPETMLTLSGAAENGSCRSKEDFRGGTALELYNEYLTTSPDDEEDEPEENNSVFIGDDSGAHSKDFSEKPLVLVVEDSNDMRRLIREDLSDSFAVLEAENGRQGFAIARERIPDLIISDIVMPEMDGLELCRTLKRNIDTSHIPVILLTAKAAEKSHIDGLETGADDYIVKPFNSVMLMTRIKNLIGLRRQLQLKIQREKMLLPVELKVSGKDEKFKSDFQKYINASIPNENFTVDKLCDKLNMPRATLFRKVQALFGESPNDYLNSCRLKQATHLLKNRKIKIIDAALSVGFSSAAHFSSCFKKKYGISPSEFRERESVEPDKSRQDAVL